MNSSRTPVIFNNWRKCWLIALAILLYITAQSVFANLIVNGDFEQNDRTTYPNYYPPPTDLAYIQVGEIVPGWTFSHSVDLYGPLNAPQNGAQFLDLVGGGPLSATYSIQQTIATVVGQTYRLDFFYGNNEQFGTYGGQASFTASLTGSGTIWSGDFTHGGDTMSNRNWTEFTVDFVADSTSTTLLFLDTNTIASIYDPTYTVAGSTLDNASIVAILPEPGGFAIVLVLSGLCAAATFARHLRRT